MVKAVIVVEKNYKLKLPLGMRPFSKLAICGPIIWLINVAPVSDGWDRGLGSDLKIWETDVLESKWDGVGPMTLWVMRAGRGWVLPSPFPSSFSWSNLGPELAHGWLRIKLLFNNRDWYLDNLGSIIKIDSILKTKFHSCLKFEPLYHSVQNNETWRWDHPFLNWSSAVLRLPVK